MSNQSISMTDQVCTPYSISDVDALIQQRFQEAKSFEAEGKLAEAAELYRKIVAVYESYGANPALPYAALGYALLNMKEFDEAEAVLKKSIENDPNCLEGHVNLGAVYRLRQQWPECISVSHKALEINPKYIAALLNLAEAQRGIRRYGMSVQNFLLVLALDNHNLDAHAGLAQNYLALGDTSVAIPMLKKILNMDPERWYTQSFLLFALQYEPTVPVEDVFAEHIEYGRIAREKIGAPCIRFSNCVSSKRRIKLAYVSGDFKYHVVMRYVEQVFALHDRDQFEIFLINTGCGPDADTERIKQHADHWIDISQTDDERAADKIRDLEIDIAVDLAGHTGVTRLPLFCRRIAPIQISWLGYSGTSGVDTMDYVIVDSVIAPPHEKHYFSEAPLRLPAAYLAFTQLNPQPVAPLPYDRNGYITFGSMNNPSKINQYVVDWWARILQAVPGSKLVLRYTLLYDPFVRERVLKLFRQAGIAENRLEVTIGPANFLDSYNEVDIALDTFPYNGTTTTCEALWMGVPVVTLRGDRFVSRVGASLLTYSGLKDLIAEAPEEYISKAVELAQDPKQLRELRRQLRPHLEKTPVFDAVTFTRGLEFKLREVFVHWCEQQSSKN